MFSLFFFLFLFFSFFSFSVVYFSYGRAARIDKPNFGASNNLWLNPPCRLFCSPLAVILDFAGGAALQAVSECPGATRLVSKLVSKHCHVGIWIYQYIFFIRLQNLYFIKTKWETPKHDTVLLKSHSQPYCSLIFRKHNFHLHYVFNRSRMVEILNT